MSNEIGINKKSSDVNKMMKKHTPDNIINSVYEFTASKTHIGYDQGRNNRNSGATWDCSELSAKTMKNMMSKMDECPINFKTNFRQLQRAFAEGSTTISQRQALDAIGIPKVSGKQAVMSDLEVGMVIYSRYPSKGQIKGHVATVSRDPSTGEMVISESNGRQGVTHRSLHSFFNGPVGSNPKTQWVRYDPFYKDRPILRAMEKEADEFLNVYKKAEQAYSREANNPYRKVGARVPSRDSFIDNYLEDNFSKQSINKTPTLKSAQSTVSQQVSDNRYNHNHNRIGVSPVKDTVPQNDGVNEANKLLNKLRLQLSDSGTKSNTLERNPLEGVNIHTIEKARILMQANNQKIDDNEINNSTVLRNTLA